METRIKTEVEMLRRMEALKLAHTTLPAQYNGQGGYIQTTFSAIKARADEILTYVTGEEAEDKASLINKLRTVLCEKT